MKKNNTIKKILTVILSNVVHMGAGILIGFIIPDILGITGYGYYKVFGLYMTYVVLFHFGFIDGIYLKYSGTDYEELNRPKFRMYFKFIFLLELLIAVAGIIISLLFIPGEKKLVFIFIFINLLVTNLTNYYNFICQITSRFKELSLRTIILSITNILIAAWMYFSKSNNYKEYIILLVFMNYILLIWYMFTYRDITFGLTDKIKDHKRELVGYIKQGIPLLLANLIATLVLTIDRQVVEVFFSVEKFGVYSFAYSMLSLINVVIAAVGIVLYPTLKKANVDKVKDNYSNLNGIIIIVILISLASYFPLTWLIPKILPNYIDSLPIFRIALPGLIFSASITAIKQNYFKLTNLNKSFLSIGFIILALCLGLNLGAYFIFRKAEYITISSVIGLAIWYIVTELYMVKKFNVQWKRNVFLIVIGSILFYTVTNLSNFIVSGTIYIVLIIFIILVLSKKDIKKFLKLKEKNK